MTPSLSIDFGSSYTKVALRADPDQPSQLLSDKNSLNLDVLNVCIPSLVTLDERNGKKEWLSGIRAVNSVPGKGITVYRNWKRDFFAADPGEVHASESNGAASTSKAAKKHLGSNKVDLTVELLDQLSQEREQLIKEIAQLKKLSTKDVARVADEQDLSIADLRQLSQKSSQPRVSSANVGTNDVALQYFRWLRTFLEPLCKSPGIPSISELPVRLCVPSFVQPMSSVGSSAMQEKVLAILREAGFLLDENYPTVTEPFANAIGTLTEGRNKTWCPRPGLRDMHMPSMFGDGTFLKQIRNLTGQYVVLAVDVGAFTTDFAYLEFNTKEFEDRPQLADFSEPLGMEQLDREIQTVLSQEKAAILGTLNLRDHENFKEIVYSGKRVCRFPKFPGVSIGAGEEKKNIQDGIHSFGMRIAKQLDEFLSAHEIGQINEVLLTGGGNLIPELRSTLRSHLEKRGDQGKTRFHGYWNATELGDNTNHKLDYRLVRAGSALGGASVYLDFMV
jgi:hypothetical protein